MTPTIILALCGLSVTLVTALLSVGFAWGAMKNRHEDLVKRIEKIEELKLSAATEVLRAEMLALRTHLDTRLDSLQKQVDSIDRRAT